MGYVRHTISVAELGMTRSLGVDLAESLKVVHRQLVSQ